jgi:hypothetical protein
MQHVGQAIVLLIVIAVTVTCVALPAWRRRKRTAAMEEVAKSLGMSFSPTRVHPPHSPYASLSIFMRGNAGEAIANTLAGSICAREHDIPIVMGDFVYWVKGGGRRFPLMVTETFSYILLRLPFDDVPNLLFRAERPADALAEAFGLEDIDFESAEFSDKFHVRCGDKRFAYDLLDARMMENAPPGLQFERGWLCLSDGQSTWEPAEFGNHLRWVNEFLDRWPPHLERAARWNR